LSITLIPFMGCPCTNLRNAKKVKNELEADPPTHPVMKKEEIQYVDCAHCEARIPLDKAVDYKHRLLYGEHYHCPDCDPRGNWDCLSHDTDLEVH